jgi:hypothetical protein
MNRHHGEASHSFQLLYTSSAAKHAKQRNLSLSQGACSSNMRTRESRISPFHCHDEGHFFNIFFKSLLTQIQPSWLDILFQIPVATLKMGITGAEVTITNDLPQTLDVSITDNTAMGDGLPGHQSVQPRQTIGQIRVSTYSWKPEESSFSVSYNGESVKVELGTGAYNTNISLLLAQLAPESAPSIGKPPSNSNCLYLETSQFTSDPSSIPT